MHFLQETIRSPKNTGAIAPSSNRLANLMIANAHIGDATAIVELGPGTGVFTKRIMQTKNKQAVFFSIEVNKVFVEEIKKIIPDATVYCDSAHEIQKYLHHHRQTSCDRIISSLPWTAFDSELQEQLLEKIHQALKLGGLFLTFAYFPFNHLRQGKIFKQKLQQKFRIVQKTKIVMNIPPAFFYICEK